MSYLTASWAVRKGPEKKTSIRRGMGFFPQTQVLKDLSNSPQATEYIPLFTPIRKKERAQKESPLRFCELSNGL